jgi:hypothetical protein
MMRHSKRAVRAERLRREQEKADAAKKARRARKAERRAARQANTGTPSILAADAVGVVPDPADTPTGVARYGLRELEERNVYSLRQLAKDLGVKGYSKFNKDDLVEYIYRSDENLVLH